MSTLLKRILFIVILLWIAYGIYRIIDRPGANELKENVVTTTQDTARSFGFDKSEIEEIFDPVVDKASESLWDPVEIVTEKNIIITNPEIKEPIIVEQKPIVEKEVKVIKKKATTKKTTSSSSNVLFQLFK